MPFPGVLDMGRSLAAGPQRDSEGLEARPVVLGAFTHLRQ